MPPPTMDESRRARDRGLEREEYDEGFMVVGLCVLCLCVYRVCRKGERG